MYPSFGILDVFQKQLAAYPGEFSEKRDQVNSGGRVLLPVSCLAELTTMNVAYPLQFRIKILDRMCYAGVLEFDSDDGIVIMPNWMFYALLLQPGDTVIIETCTLPPGKLIKLRPQQSSFVELSDPRHVLEMYLNQYPALTRGTSIVLHYLDRNFIIDVTDIKDDMDRSVDAISTVRADAKATELKVEFERPLDMPLTPEEEALSPPEGSNVIGSSGSLEFSSFTFKPPTIGGDKKANDASAKEQLQDEKVKPGFVPFSGGGRCLRGGPSATRNCAKKETNTAEKTPEEIAREVRERRLKAFASAKSQKR